MPCCPRRGRRPKLFLSGEYHGHRAPPATTPIRPSGAHRHHADTRAGTAAQLHPGRHAGRPADEPLGRARRHAVPARAQRLPPHRARQGDLDRLRPRAGVRRDLPPALRRHQPRQGGRRVRRGHPGGRALARLRLGPAPLLRLRLLRAALPVGGGADPPRARLRRRPLRRGDPAVPRHADRARPEQPVPRPPGRGEPRPLPPDARGRVPGRRARAPGEDRHGLAQHEPAGPDALPDPPRGPSPDGRPLVHLPDVRLRAPPVGLDRADHPLPLHPRVRGPPAALRLGVRGALHLPSRSRSSSRGSTSPTR